MRGHASRVMPTRGGDHGDGEKKICSQCGQNKPASCFGKAGRACKKKDENRSYMDYCRLCASNSTEKANQRSYKRLLRERTLNEQDIDRWCGWRAWAYRKKGGDVDGPYLADLFRRQNGMCYYTGVPLKISKAISHESVSLDRIEPSKGYTKGNVVFCSFMANQMKGNRTEKEFYKDMRAILAHRGQIER